MTPVENVKERVFQVLGSQTLRDLTELEPRETELTLPPRYGAPAAAILPHRSDIVIRLGARFPPALRAGSVRTMTHS